MFPLYGKRFPALLTFLLLLLAALVRLRYAWLGRGISDPDSSVVALMASHIAALRDFPIFFYGQSYMGSLEPAISAFFMAFLGHNGFALSLGVAFASLVALWLLARWGRDAAGPWGAPAALLLAILGPAIYFKFQIAPRGGYMVALAIDNALLLLAARIAADLHASDTIRPRHALLFGVLAGLGLWSNMIIVSALGAACLLILIGMRGRFWRHWRAILLAAAAGVAGLFPLLFHICRNGFDVLSMSRMGAAPSSVRQLLMEAWTRLLQSQTGSRPGHDVPLAVAMVLLTLLPALAALLLAWRRRRNLPPLALFAIGAAALHLLLFAAVYLVSGFPMLNAPRYLIPATPSLSLLAGAALVLPWQKTEKKTVISRLSGPVLALAAVALLALQIHVARLSFSAAAETTRRADEQTTVLANALSDAQLGPNPPDALLGPNTLYPFNFVLHEAIPVSDGRQEFYSPIRRAAELARFPAYHNSWLGIAALLESVGASYTLYSRHILADIVPPPSDFAEDEIATLPAPVIPEIGSTQTVCRLPLPPGRSIDAPLLLQLRFSTATHTPLHQLVNGVTVAAASEGQPDTILTKISSVPLEWSVCRAYRNDCPVMEAYLRPPISPETLVAGYVPPEEYLRPLIPPGTDALTITLRHVPVRPGPDDAPPAWLLRNVWLFATSGPDVQTIAPLPTPPDADMISALVVALDETPDIPLISPRYYACQLLAAGVPQSRLLSLSPRIFPADDAPPPAAWDPDTIARLPLDGRPFLVCLHRRYLPTLLRELAPYGISPVTVPLPSPYVLLRIDAYAPAIPGARLRIAAPIPLPDS